MIVHKSITVARPPDVAFKLFVEEVAQWWPKGTGHSFLGGDARPMFEGGRGGRFVERSSDGREYVIGEILAYEPGSRITYTWNHEEGKGTTQVDVRFIADGTGTRIEVAHSGWENVSDDALSAGYDQGWDLVLGYYVEHAGTAT